MMARLTSGGYSLAVAALLAAFVAVVFYFPSFGGRAETVQPIERDDSSRVNSGSGPVELKGPVLAGELHLTPQAKLVAGGEAEREGGGSLDVFFDDATVDSLRDEMAALEAVMAEESGPAHAAMYEAGRFEYVGTSEPGKPFEIPIDNYVLASYRFEPFGVVTRTVLAEDEYPDLYSFRHLILALRAQIKSRTQGQLETGD